MTTQQQPEPERTPRPRGWLVSLAGWVASLITFAVIGAVAVHYDHAKLTPGPLLWFAVFGAASPWLGATVRDYIRERAHAAEKLEQQRRVAEAIAAVPQAQRLLLGLADVARERQSITGVLEAVALVADQRRQELQEGGRDARRG